jgi:hypothetical protein
MGAAAMVTTAATAMKLRLRGLLLPAMLLRLAMRWRQATESASAVWAAAPWTA